MAFICYLILKEANIHINLICFDRNFDHPHINVVIFVPRKQSKSHHFFHKNTFVEKVFDIATFSENCCLTLFERGRGQNEGFAKYSQKWFNRSSQNFMTLKTVIKVIF